MGVDKKDRKELDKMKHVIVVSMLFGALLVFLVIAAVCFILMLIQRRKRQENQEPEKGMVYREAASANEMPEKWFLPTEMLELLNIQETAKNAADISRKPKELDAVILNANIAGFSKKISGRKMEQVYELINGTLSSCIPEIYRKGGMIDRFRDAGVVALFTERREAALEAAVSVCEEMIRRGENHRDFSIGLCYGNVMVGVVGAQKRLSVLTLSAYTGFGEFLQKKAPDYYATILAAESYISQLEEFRNNYNYRLLGYFYMQTADCLEAVYDVFDGDEAGIRNCKRKTRLLFEKGVGLFKKRNFADARTYFIEVLKADRNDTAAREYVFRCDKYSSLTEAEQEKADIYLECY